MQVRQRRRHQTDAVAACDHSSRYDHILAVEGDLRLDADAPRVGQAATVVIDANAISLFDSTSEARLT